jgi:hypothetical protein
VFIYALYSSSAGFGADTGVVAVCAIFSAEYTEEAVGGATGASVGVGVVAIGTGTGVGAVGVSVTIAGIGIGFISSAI